MQDLLLWSYPRVRLPAALGDAFVQTSSIMPQKRNPVALEHARAWQQALGEAQAIFTCAHNTPFGDIVDSEDDLQPLAFTALGDAVRALRLLAGLLETAEVDRGRLARRAGSDFITVTELADTLVRRAGMSFRAAHALVARAVEAAAGDDRPQSVAEALLSQNGAAVLSREEIERALDPVNFERVRRVAGGPAPDIASESLSRARIEQARIEEWIASKQALLEAARRENTGA